MNKKDIKWPFDIKHFISYKLSCSRNMFNLDLRSYLSLATERLSMNTLEQDTLCIISNLMTLLKVRAGQSVLDNLNQDQIDAMIVHLSTD